MRTYELMFVVDPRVADEEVVTMTQDYKNMITAGGSQITGEENWGRRKLAYEIGPHKEGTYVLETIDGGGELMKEIDRRLKVSDLVIRHLVVRIDEEQSVIERVKTLRTETTRRRRVARGLPPDRQPGEGQRGDVDDDRDDRFDLNEGLER